MRRLDGRMLWLGMRFASFRRRTAWRTANYDASDASVYACKASSFDEALCGLQTRLDRVYREKKEVDRGPSESACLEDSERCAARSVLETDH